MNFINTHILTKLGEGPSWHPKRESWLWLDIISNQVFELPFHAGDKKPSILQVPEYPSAIFPAGNDAALVLARTGIFKVNLDTAMVNSCVTINIPDNYRTNDAAIASDGRLWFGVMEIQPSGHTGESAKWAFLIFLSKTMLR